MCCHILYLITARFIGIKKEWTRTCHATAMALTTKFSNDVSAMKKLAARDFEDLLQVGHLAAIPCTDISY